MLSCFVKLFKSTNYNLEDVRITIESFSAMREKLDKGVYKRIASSMKF